MCIRDRLETFTKPYVSFVKITVEDGSVGYGQMSTYHADITAQIFHKQVAPWVLGKEYFDFDDAPVIDPNFLSHEEDIYDVKCAINFSKVLANTNSIKKIRNESVTHDLLNASEEEMVDHFKSNAVSIYHPCGTCKMDEDPKKGVVSERLKVHGMENLWIADASVFPNITSGNINAPVMMLAYLGSKFIIEDLNKI